MPEKFNPDSFKAKIEKIPEIPPFKIEVASNLNLPQMQDLFHNGDPLMRSAHIGNQYPSNQVLAASGIPTLHYDRTLPSKDTNYHPGTVIQGGKKKIILLPGNEDVITRNLTVDGTDLFRYHADILRTVYPDAKVQKYADYLSSNRDLALEIITSIDFNRSIWGRKVLNGRITPADPENAQEVLNNLLDITSDNDDGYILENNLNILIFGLIDYINANLGLSTPGKIGYVYHVSGPDMIKYFPKESNQTELSKIYSQIREKNARLRGMLPESLIFVLLPSTQFSLSVPNYKRDTLDNMLAAKESISRLSIEKAIAIKSATTETRPAVIENFNGRKKELEALETSCLIEIYCDIMPTLKNGDFYTQYDASVDSNIYLPDYTKYTPADEVIAYLKKLNIDYQKSQNN